MRRFKNILVLYDSSIGSDDALGQAARLAAANGARLTMADVLPDGHGTALLLEERRKQLSRLEPAVHAQGVEKVSVRVLTGTVFLEITRTVMRDEIDLVIASAEGGSVLKSIFFGSTVTHLIRKCPCPVWVLKPGQPVPYRRVLAAVDPAGGAADKLPLNVKILEIAASLAEAGEGELHVVHGWAVRGQDKHTITSEVRDETKSDILAKHEAEHRAQVEALIGQANLHGVEPTLHLPRDLAERVIVGVSETEDIDIIVMGSVTRTGIAGLLMGNTAENVLSAVQRSVFAIKPDGFRTPVSLEDSMISPAVAA